MRVAAILERTSLTPIVALVVLAWAVIAFTPMAHEPVTFMFGWTAMCAAMMLPTVFGAGQFAAAGSPARAFAFSVGYIAVWMCTAPFAYVVMHAITWTIPSLLLATIGVGVYQLTPLVRRALAKCHERRRCARPTVFGAKQGVACVLSCFPAMLLVMLFLDALHPPVAVSLFVLAVVTMLMAFEKLRPSGGMVIGVLLVAAASIALVTGVGVQIGTPGNVSHLNQHQVGASG